MAKLPRLGYASAAEELAERFHMSDDLLRRLNPGTDLAKAGSRIVVANVTPMRLRSGETTAGGGDAKAETKAEAKAETKTGSQATRQAPSQTAGATAAKVEVDKRERAVRVLDASGALIAFFPASIGSAEKPAPSGTFKVTRLSYNPTYHYDPKFHFKEVKTQHAFTVKPGPNNPVGLVWIDLSAPSYGIHGAPNPAAISKTQSHGCVRLTNWDALALATMVRRGTPVDFVD
jgi:lipoprotein-anchoring transpeptidase ErfK/SrfK